MMCCRDDGREGCWMVGGLLGGWWMVGRVRMSEVVSLWGAVGQIVGEGGGSFRKPEVWSNVAKKFWSRPTIRSGKVSQNLVTNYPNNQYVRNQINSGFPQDFPLAICGIAIMLHLCIWVSLSSKLADRQTRPFRRHSELQEAERAFVETNLNLWSPSQLSSSGFERCIGCIWERTS